MISRAHIGVLVQVLVWRAGAGVLCGRAGAGAGAGAGFSTDRLRLGTLHRFPSWMTWCHASDIMSC